MTIETITVGKRTEVRITASDKGPGIENLDLAFSKFYNHNNYCFHHSIFFQKIC